MSRALLITGATGKQGGAVIDALVDNEKIQSEFTILAVTRNPSSSSAQKLASKSPSVKVIGGNLDNVSKLFDSAQQALNGAQVWGVYSVQISQGKDASHDGEIRQGKSLVDEALKRGVKHFVYSSVERGGEQHSWDNATPIPHFQTKYEIERHLRDAAKQDGDKMGWTILRPVAFMDNLTPAFPSKVFLAAMRDTMKSKKNQWVATKDIGIFGAKAFASSKEYNHKAIGLAGDELNAEEVGQVVGKMTGAPLTPTWYILGQTLMYMVTELGIMIKWFGSEGYKADISECKRLNPEMMDFETWLVKDSPFTTK